MVGGGIPMNCPHCGRRMTHLISQAPWHFYECRNCGLFTQPARGPIRATEVGDYFAAMEDTGAPSMRDVVYLTREGCVNTATMRTRFDEALGALGWSHDYQVIDADALPGTDARRGYWTPTILFKNVDLFGMPPVQNETPT